MFYGRLPDSATRLSATHYCRTAGRSRKGLGQQGGLLFYNSFFPLLPTGSELLLTSHFLTGGLAICKFFMELEQLLLQTGKMAGMSDIGFFFIRINPAIEGLEQKQERQEPDLQKDDACSRKPDKVVHPATCRVILMLPEAPSVPVR